MRVWRNTRALPDGGRGRARRGFQDAVIDVLVAKTIRAAARGARSIVMGGGVAANSVLRARLAGGPRRSACR